jgi:hypothetical protein
VLGAGEARVHKGALNGFLPVSCAFAAPHDQMEKKEHYFGGMNFGPMKGIIDYF